MVARGPGSSYHQGCRTKNNRYARAHANLTMKSSLVTHRAIEKVLHGCFMGWQPFLSCLLYSACAFSTLGLKSPHLSVCRICNDGQPGCGASHARADAVGHTEKHKQPDCVVPCDVHLHITAGNKDYQLLQAVGGKMNLPTAYCSAHGCVCCMFWATCCDDITSSSRGNGLCACRRLD